MALSAEQALSVSQTYTEETVKGAGAIKGKDGRDGVDGISPTAKVERIETGARITIEDKNGITTANIQDGNAVISVDTEFSTTSNHPIANSTVATKFNSVDNAINVVSNKANANEQAISVLNGTGTGSVEKIVVDKVAEIVSDAPEDFDTLKEISDWISDHEDSAAAMNSQIQTNKENISLLSSGKADKRDVTDLKTADYGAGVNLFDFDAYADAVNQANDKVIISNNGDNTYDVADIRAPHNYYEKYGVFKFSETDVDVIFSIKLKKGSGIKVFVSLWDSAGNKVASGSNEDEEGSITLQGKASGIVFSYGADGSYTFIEPIIRPASITDDTFYPYIKTNKTLTQDTDGVRGVGRNLLNLIYESATINGLTFIVDKLAGTVTVNGTATGTQNTEYKLSSNANSNDIAIEQDKSYILTGTPSNISGCYVRFGDNQKNEYWVYDRGNGAEVTIASDFVVDKTTAYIGVSPGVTLSNVVFKPMIRSAKYADDSTFYPYSQNEIEFQHFMYDEGTFVAAYSFHGGNTDTTTGHFHKVGKMVFIQVPFTTTSAVTINGNDLLFSLSSLPSAYPFRTDYGLYLPNLALYNLTPILSYDRVRAYARETFELPANTKMLFSLAYVTS